MSCLSISFPTRAICQQEATRRNTTRSATGPSSRTHCPIILAIDDRLTVVKSAFDPCGRRIIARYGMESGLDVTLGTGNSAFAPFVLGVGVVSTGCLGGLSTTGG